MLKVLRRLLALGFVVCLVWAGLNWQRTQERKAYQEELRELFESTAGELEIREDGTVEVLLPEDEEDPLQNDPLRLRNPDYIGWVKVYGTQVDHPVVQAEDNRYYLDRNFDLVPDATGCAFADSAVERGTKGNLLIYGHHMGDGTMFGSLDKFRNKSFFEEHELILWRQGDRASLYRIFSVLVVPGYSENANYFPIQEYVNEIGTEKTEELIDELRERSQLWRDIDLKETDRFIFLMTCDYTINNGRLLVCGRRLGK